MVSESSHSKRQGTKAVETRPPLPPPRKDPGGIPTHPSETPVAWTGRVQLVSHLAGIVALPFIVCGPIDAPPRAPAMSAQSPMTLNAATRGKEQTRNVF